MPPLLAANIVVVVVVGMALLASVGVNSVVRPRMTTKQHAIAAAVVLRHHLRLAISTDRYRGLLGAVCVRVSARCLWR